jgi:hypothetical protein
MTSLKLPTTDITDVGNYPGDGPLRAGGVTKPGLPTEGRNRPDTRSDSAKKQAVALAIVRDVWAGTERIREEGSTYLPKAPGEDPDNYRVRLERSVFYNVFGRTIDGLCGQVFRRDPKLEDDVPAVIVTQTENIDNAGTHFDVFVRDLLQDALTAGHNAIFVEFPATGGTQKRDKELPTGPGKQAPIRPYWILIQKENILSWRTTVEDGQTILTQVVLRECTRVADGQFGEKEQVRYRVLYRDNSVVGFSLLEIMENKSVVEVDRGLYPTQTEIPLAEITTSGRKGIFESDPPLLDLAYLNIAHYQQWSDYATSLHKTCVPILTLIGADTGEEGGQKIVVGPNTVLTLPSGQGVDAKYVSHSGQALAECKASLDDLKSDMGTLGIAMLSPQKRTAETASAKRLDKATEDSALAVTARGLQDGIEKALQLHANYLRLPSGGSVDINREFEEQTMQADMLSAWTGAVSTAGIPSRFLVTAMQDGGLIGPEEDPQSIADEMEAAQAAKADAERQAMIDKASISASAGKPQGDVHVSKNSDGSMTMSRKKAAA